MASISSPSDRSTFAVATTSTRGAPAGAITASPRSTARATDRGTSKWHR